MNPANERLEAYRIFLRERERSPYTIRKYLHDIRVFIRFCEDRDEGKRTEHMDHAPHAGGALYPELSRESVLEYKQYLQQRYMACSVNSMLNALNGYLKFIGRPELCVRMLRQQRLLFRDEHRFLKKTEYRRLVGEADRKGNTRLSCILQTLCMTGIRIGELQYVRAECLKRNMIRIEHKGKIRDIVVPRDLTRLLKAFCHARGIKAGPIFITRSGKPVDRKNVWKEMKRICVRAGVEARKVFPHNLRHLFAVSFYERTKDIVRLADYLGHSNLETTRRYTAISTMEACQRELDLGLLVTDAFGQRLICRSKRRQKREAYLEIIKR